MKQVIFEHAAEIITALVTCGLAWIKRRLDIRELKRNPARINDL